jgi:hypothetical protein
MRPLRTALLGALVFLGLAGNGAEAQEVSSASAGVFRALDKVSGETVDLQIAAGSRAAVGTLEISLIECRFPVDNLAGNAYAALQISEYGSERPLFSGWMIASAPALSALEHPRYDVWVMRCATS